MHQFLLGALTIASWMTALFFLRFWRQSGDRLLLVFATAFFVLGIDSGVRGIWEPSSDVRHYYFLIRLLAFVLLIGGIIDKNRSRPRE